MIYSVDMDDLFDISKLNLKNLLYGLAFCIVAVIICFLINKIRAKLLEQVDDSDAGVRRRAAVTTISNATKLFVIVFSALTVLQINGINVTSILTGLGIISAVTALAIQDTAKDFIQGMRIISEGFYSAGDYIRYDGRDCQVVEFTALTTKLVDLASNDPITVCNRNVTDVTKISGKEYIRIALPYDMKPEESETFMQDAMKDVYAIKGVKACRYLGLQDMGESSAIHLIQITCHPKQARQMIRNTKMVFFKLMTEKGIEVPYNKLEVLEPQKDKKNRSGK